MSRTVYLVLAGAIYIGLFICSFCSGPHPAEARNLCQRPVYMMTSVECNRIPTITKPYCPAPGY